MKYIQLEIPFDFEEEEFKDIANYEGLYQVTNQGRVYSLISKKFLKPEKDKHGYLRVNLYKNNKMKHYLLHRLVANAFIPNPLHLPQINHISEIKSDNRACNLEYCTAKYNANYGSRNQRVLAHPNFIARVERMVEKLSKPVLQFTREGKFVAEYSSTREAERRLGINHQSICRCCRGDKNYSHAGKFLWKFKEEVA